MTEGDVLGWMAAGLTLLTFSMRSMVALRTVAVAASLCFIVYGALGALYPVLALHLLLLPCNLLRLRQLCRRQSETASDVRKNAFIPADKWSPISKEAAGRTIPSANQTGALGQGRPGVYPYGHSPPRLLCRIRDLDDDTARAGRSKPVQRRKPPR